MMIKRRRKGFYVVIVALLFSHLLACVQDVTRPSYTVHFDTQGGEAVSSMTIEQGKTLTLPIPVKEGYTFTGWFTSLDPHAAPFHQYTPVFTDIKLYARWKISQYMVTFVTNGDMSIEPIKYPRGTDLSKVLKSIIPMKDSYVFSGWYANETFTEQHLIMPAENITLYAFYELKSMPTMVQVGEPNTDYTIPTGVDDGSQATVKGGYLMATTQTTYKLWHEVRVWAEDHGYHFQNFGLPGSHNTDGVPWPDDDPLTPPDVTGENKYQPVTMVSWRDAIVWLNALSEMHGLRPVYRDVSNQVIRNSRDDHAHVVDTAIHTDYNGYRLPTSHEWEMAARWKHDTVSTDGSMLVGGRFWTPGHYASGATDDITNEAETRAVAWYAGAAGGDFTRPVGQLLPNHLGMYDMSGNVWEWTSSGYRFGNHSAWHPHFRGGAWDSDVNIVRLQRRISYPAHGVFNQIGFRFVRYP